jgi:hypothetical protein
MLAMVLDVVIASPALSMSTLPACPTAGRR